MGKYFSTYLPGMENLNRIYSGATQSSTPELPTFGGGSSSSMIGVLGGGSGGGNNVKTISQKDIGTFSAPSYKLPDYSQMGDAPTYKMPDFSKMGIPTYQMPNYTMLGDAPTYQDPGGYSPGGYTAPAYNEAKVRALTQEQASAGVRGLRSAIQRVMSQRHDNPNVKRMTLRDALAGYGQGLANVMGSAADKARELYNTEYGHQADAAKTSYQARTQAGMQKAQLGAEAARANFEAQFKAYGMKWEDLSTAAKAKFEADMNKYGMDRNDISDAAKTNFEAEFKKYGMKWEDLSTKAQQEYQGQLQSAMANFQSKSDIAKFNASAQNTMTQSKMNMDLQKQLAEYNAAVEDYMNQREGKYTDSGTAKRGGTIGIGNTYDRNGNIVK